MNDDWRLQIDLHEEDHADALAERLDAHQLQRGLSHAFHDRLIVTQDGSRVFLYAGTREQVENGRKIVDSEARRHGWNVNIDLRRWHPIAEEWEDPDKALPVDQAARLAEREALMARERDETARRGYPEFEVRVDLPSRRAAVSLFEQLQKEGVPAVHRWRYLLVGAPDEDSAKMLAERIRREACSGSRVQVEGTWAVAYGKCSPSPFTVMGK